MVTARRLLATSAFAVVALLSLGGLAAPASAPVAPPPAPVPQGAPDKQIPPVKSSLDETAAAATGQEPRVHHAAPAVARAHVPLPLRILVERPDLVRRAILVYRLAPGTGELVTPAWHEMDFLRAPAGPYIATVPTDAVRPPGLEYFVELELLDGRREAAFASRAMPQRVSVSEDAMDARERVALEHFGGRRSALDGAFEYVRFGSQSGAAADWYYRAEGAYTYRMLRTVHEFGVRVGVVRGRSPGNEGTVGLNYAAASLKLRIADVFRIEGELFTSVSELGFAGGGGGALELGEAFGAELRLGVEAVHDFGVRWYSRVDVPIVPRLRLSPMVEATNLPHADRYGVRLLGEVAYDFGSGISAALQGGYQARKSTDGGPSAGGTIVLAF